MKKTSVYSLFIMSSFLFSCGNASTENAQDEVSATPNQRAMMEMPAPPVGQTTIPAPTGTGTHLFMTAEAINYIGYYKNIQQKIAKNSFVFETQQLLDYINASNSTIVNFILGTNQATDTLFLFVSPVGKDGKHQFYDRNDTCFVLTETFAVAIPTTLEQQSSTIDTFFMEAMDLQGAQGMINAYAASNSMPNEHGWLYNAHDLAGYLQAGLNAPGGMQYTQFILSLDQKGLPHLIIVGSNDGTNHMYFDFNQAQCVMDNAMPCPFCDIASGGSTFDPPPCNFDKSPKK